MKKIIAASFFPLFLIPATGAIAEEASAAAAPASPLHAYGGVGLLLQSQTLTDSGYGDTSFTGGGLMLNGAGGYDNGTGVGFGFSGEMGFAANTNADNSDLTTSTFLMGFDGGVLLAKVFYLSMGIQMFNQTPDDSDITQTYFTIPFGVGMLSTKDDGYMLAQLRFGPGTVSNNQTSYTEDIGMFGIRLVGQTGTAKGLQFMGGLEFDNYSFSSSDTTDFQFRAFFGLGFGG